MWNIPNSLTLSRIFMIPILMVVYLYDTKWSNMASAAIFGLAAITDWFDGYLARKLGQSSSFGAFLDPVADKLMVSTALILLVFVHGENLLIIISAIVIIGREITISALREWMAELGKRANVAVSMLGKIKTFAQMVSITFLLYYDELLSLPIFHIGEVLLIISAVLTIVSMFIYLKAAWQVMKNT
ncbi:MAG: CDP-diacylglycerol--glycerol-3-phosphate 3-phosphatidyltransferase [Gammaproteobacteria bacterium]|nr:CDP-diacylglycerol--glycerol-3-phosphate 3-phosphatidyltransferase [Alphaproteobacteria bacterium]MCK5334857.1 CDP-diacylglycerol--glycerol-3-phosphate 3-phosphatidyltransferase [Gammaproteobacteria bacterium]